MVGPSSQRSEATGVVDAHAPLPARPRIFCGVVAGSPAQRSPTGRASVARSLVQRKRGAGSNSYCRSNRQSICINYVLARSPTFASSISPCPGGPWCTQTLGDLGADGDQVERPTPATTPAHGARRGYTDGEGKPTTDSAYFSSCNRNKRSITVDISKPEGQRLRGLATKCDILV